MSVGCAVIVMAKAPVPGYAKTRLVPALGEVGAAEVAERLLSRTVDVALAARLGRVELCCTPGPQHAAFARFLGRAGLELEAQGHGDLGERMQRALERALTRDGGMRPRALLIGTDAPALNADTLRQAAGALLHADAVFVPAHDGGYALVGLSRRAPALFDSVPWSTSRVMAETRKRLRRSGLHHVELAPVHDIDEPADLVHLPQGWIR